MVGSTHLYGVVALFSANSFHPQRSAFAWLELLRSSEFSLRTVGDPLEHFEHAWRRDKTNQISRHFRISICSAFPDPWSLNKRSVYSVCYLLFSNDFSALTSIRNQLAVPQDTIVTPQDNRLTFLKQWLESSPGAQDLFEIWDNANPVRFTSSDK